GYLRLADGAILSLSPERFLKLGKGKVETRPIKGTRPRGKTPEEDMALAASLLASPKDRAENLMIVDLLRNDIGRSCQPGSVRVPELFALESYPNVHHLVSSVTGELAPGKDALDLLEGSFPGGSITGAPKIRAMQIID
ncbi:chorismate-binding protein, partial [Pseudomonas aeruginosa]